ncbi:MAG: multicopper oxidase domain-containing protein, partial [Gammaproteobacteria bacterium]
MPKGNDLDAFLAERINPLPTREANLTLPNAWHDKIEQCVRPLATSYREGRPPGEYFAHQRWEEFYPTVYSQSAQTGARRNRGLRDSLQLHGYAAGEFGPGGLYHNTTGTGGGFDGSTDGIKVRFHRRMPVQKRRALWTFDGTFPPKLLMARYGFPILFRHHNALPINPGANFGFGLHTLSTHEHNGHNPAESDGYTQAFFFPGQFYDYRWPMILAGYDHKNKNATNPKAATPDGNGGIINIPGDWRETMSTHWFHDHMLDFTAQNVYKGNAAMMNYYSALDRGNEGLPCHYENKDNVNLCLPSGTALDWGNRDYDVNLMLADKAWDAGGQLFFNIFNLDGFMGDRMTVNWLYKPYFEVRARRYRFRILNASVSRYFTLALVDESGSRVPFHMVANDGNLMEHAVEFPNSESADLPTQAIAERYDIVVDFGQFQAGKKLYLVNRLEHRNGKRPHAAIPLENVLSGAYQAGPDVDPAVGKFLEFRVKAYSGEDLSMDPARYVEGKKKMIRLPRFTANQLANARHRTFEFGRSNGT